MNTTKWAVGVQHASVHMPHTVHMQVRYIKGLLRRDSDSAFKPAS